MSAAPDKRCSACTIERPPGDFSSAQLKKQGRRVCKACVAQQMMEEAVKVWSISADKQQQQQQQNNSSSSTELCLVCVREQHDGAPCAMCTGHCCSLSCFRRHKETAQCERVRTLPMSPVDIADEDRLGTIEQVVDQLDALRIQVEQQCREAHEALFASSIKQVPFLPPPSRPTFGKSRRDFVALASVLVPLHSSSARASGWWWTRQHESESPTAPSLASMMCNVVHAFSEQHRYTAMCIGSRDLQEDAKNHEFFLVGVKRETAFTLACPFEDVSRIFHRLLTYTIYYYRHMPADLLMMPRDVEHLLDVHNDAQGVLPTAVHGEQWWGLAYCTLSDATRVPVAVLNASRTGTTFVRARMSRYTCGISFSQGRLQCAPTLAVVRDQQFTSVFAAQSAAQKFQLARVNLAMPSEQICTSLGYTPAMIAKMRTLSFVGLVQDMLGDEWPAIDHTVCIALPTPGLEHEVVELLLLYELQALQEQGSVTHQPVIASIEADSNTSLSELIHAQTTRLEQMLQDQRDQLDIHAAVVARAEQRSKSFLGQPAFASSATASSSSSSAAAMAASATSTSIASASASPSSPLDILMAEGRLKFRRVKKLLMAILKTSPLVATSTQQHGSHLVTHMAGASPWTFVQHHAGRSKDSLVARSVRTRICAQLMAIVDAQLA
jgi:hypothetical protein